MGENQDQEQLADQEHSSLATTSGPAREEAKELRKKASNLSRENRAPEGIEGTALLVGERQAEADRVEGAGPRAGGDGQAGRYHRVGGPHCQADKKSEMKYGRGIAS